MEFSLHQLRSTYIDIDLDAIGHNFQALARLTREKTKLMAVVKADAYGHGALEVSKACCSAGADYLAVAILEEGIFLRENGLKTPILILGATPAQRAGEVVNYDLTQEVSSPELVKALAASARAAKKQAKVHVKIETGMNRLGAVPGGDLNDLIASLKAHRHDLNVEGAFSHFAKADAQDKAYAADQYEVFEAGIKALTDAGFSPLLKHIANSAAIIDLPQMNLDMVRQGISLYGYFPSREVRQTVDLRPALSWITHIAHLKKVPAGSAIGYGCTYTAEQEATIATLPVGYADGYPRLLSNRGHVLVRGRRAPIVGRICMDQLMVDVTGIPGAALGDEAVLIGAQAGQRISADDLADQTGTISYEILTGIGSRVPRVTRQGGRMVLVEDRFRGRTLWTRD